MGKKIPLLISTLTLCLSSLAPTVAWAEEEPRTAWTYEEMAALNVEYEREIAENCETDDPMCADSYIYSKSGDIYRALGHYRERGLTITHINPNNHTIKVIYDSGILSRWSPNKLTVKDLDIVQGEIGYYVSGNLVDAVINNRASVLEHLRVLFANNDTDASNVWLPSGTEMEFSVPELASLDELGPAERLYSSEPMNPTKYRPALNVSYRMSDSLSAWDDSFDFSGCLAELDQTKECRIMYGANSPFYVAVEAPVIDTSSNSDDALNMQNTNASSDGAVGYGSYQLAQIDESMPTTTSAPAVSSVATPDTGQNITGNQTNAIEFPWWLGAIFAFGLATLIWLFRPKTKKTLKKS